MGFWTQDLDRMEEFYVRIMGFRVTSRSGPGAKVPGGASLFLRCDRTHHEVVFFQATEGAPSVGLEPGGGSGAGLLNRTAISGKCNRCKLSEN